MDVIFRILSVIIAFIIFVMVIIVWLWYRDPYYLITWWNRKIKTECDKQDERSLNGIPSYHDAWDCPNKTATELHQLIQLNHDDILFEVHEIIKDYDDNSSTELLPTDNSEFKWFKNEDKWNPIWVKFVGEWTKTSDQLPALKRIAALFPDIITLHVSIFNPGNTLIHHRSPSRAVYRYHYGLKIPYGDVGLKIAGYDVKWKEREGFIWDDTLSHSAWNHTSEPRIVIFADILRDLSPINAFGSKIIYSLLQRNKQRLEF